MHELSVIYPIVKMATKIAHDHNIEVVTSVRLAVGEMHDLVDSYVYKYYERFTKGTPLEGSKLVMRKIPIIYKCRRCVNEISFTNFSFAGADTTCTSCGSTETDLISGRELQIEGLEYISQERTDNSHDIN